MIAASEPQEFIPFGRQQILEHPGAIQIEVQENLYQSESALSNRLKEVNLSDSVEKSESWILRETINETIECEEELYFKGKTVVWSVGPALSENRNNRVLKCCYTSEMPIIDALWCNFHLSTPDLASPYLQEPTKVKQININCKNDKDNEDLKNCVCIMDANHIKFYTKSGKEYLTTLQFKVLKIWAMKYGLIFERRVDKNEKDVGDSKENIIEVHTFSPQSFRVSYRTSSMDLRRQSIEQSFLQNHKDLTEKSAFGSTLYLNLPSVRQEDFSSLKTASTSSSGVDESADLPVIFSLSHPLDEICPVVAKNDTLSYVSNPDVKMIFTSEAPSLCMTYDRKTKLHSVHLIRKAQPQESEICLHRESMISRTSRIHHSYNNSGKPCYSNSASSSLNLQNGNVSMPAFLNARTRKSLGLTHSVFPNVPNSPFNAFERPRHSSPIASRNISPAFSHNLYTPSPRRNDSSLNSFYGETPNRIESRMMTEDIEYAEPKPLYPQICLQHVWTESLTNNSGSSSEASRAFIAKDLCGQFYLCYLIRSKNLLNLLEMKYNNDRSITFGAALYINAKDACELASLDMIAIIGFDGGVEVYSGVTPVAKILISGIPSCIATSSYLSDSNSGPRFFKLTSINAFPKRSSLISHSLLSQAQHSPLFNDSLSQLSPVTTLESTCFDKLTPNMTTTTSNLVSSPREGYLIGLRDSVASRVSLEFSTGMLFRMEMPTFGNSPLVKSCLNALRQVLPKELFLKLSIKWYCTRNVPGCQNVDAEEEWSMLSDVLLELMGYDVELLKGTKLDIEKSPVIRAKKQKKSEKSGDEDWNYLIDSKHHEICLDQIRHVLGLGMMNGDSKVSAECESFSGITETPVISNRSTSSDGRYDFLDASRTPVDKNRCGSKFKSSFIKLQEKSSLESIDETPLQPKAPHGKSKVGNRFKISLDEGDISPIPHHETPHRIYEEHIYVNKKSPLYPFIIWVLFALHLLYEDMKLNELKKKFLPALARLLHLLASDLKLAEYVHHYWMDFPIICPINESSCKEEFRIEVANFPRCFQKTPPSIFHHFHQMLLKKKVEPYPFVYKINNRTKNLIQLIGLLSYGYENPGISMDTLVKNVNFNGNARGKPSDKGKSPRGRSHRPIPHRVILLMIQMGITPDSLQTLPPGVSLCLYEALYSCRDNPGFGWSKEAYKLAMRHDLASFCRQNSKEEVGPTNELIMPSGSGSFKNNSTIRMNMDLEEDGMEDLTNMDVLKLRFSTDQRVLEARRMLQSSQPVRITIPQRPDVTDHEFIQEQEKHLYTICLRTMALPVGRGMMTLRTSTPVITEKLPIPLLCLTGRVPPTDKVVDMSHIEVASNMNVWPLFHNGVAAGLRISPNAPDIDSQWIIFNKPKTNNEEVIEHAGFLMALGLNGHLSNLLDRNIFHYLIKIHEMTSVGLLLGIAASKRGTMDPYTVRIVSLHIEAMLPPTGIELDVDVVVEPAALISLGFLYQGTAHRHIAQVLLQEIGRPPGPEMANSVDRESYSLAAGLALGLVAFGRGAKLSGLGDMAIADTLHHYMVGGPKRSYLGSQREKYRTPSFLIWEGDLVNTHVTGPGAVLALGMLYFNTGNKAVAEWLKAPETQHLLEVVLPDALLLRTLARGLILWDEIEPTESWVMSHVPEFTRPYCLVKPEANADECIDYETMDQAYCNIVAGACMAIGLRFAGSAYEEAFETLFSCAKMFTSLLGKNIGELCGRSTIETCLNVVTVSLAMVMAGTGDLEVLRLCRYLRSRVGPTNTVATYGSHLATHMAIGLLFVGGGSYTLSTSPEAIAALLCAFYPKWPIHTNDNRYHLQALRHLYVLAVEPRLLLPRDIDTRTLCYAHITCVYSDVPRYKGKVVKLRAPCLLPELNLLKEVRIDDNRYWSIIFTRDKNWNDFTNILSECSFVDVKQRAGCLSYLEDPQGFRSLLAQTLTSDDVIPWTIRVETIFGFSSDPILVNFTQYFLEGRDNRDSNCIEDKMVMWLTYITYYCLTKDKLSLLPIWVSLLKAGQNVLHNASSFDVWQLKLMWCQALRSSGSYNTSVLIPPDTVLSIKQYFNKCLESWENDIGRLIANYLKNELDPNSKDQDKLTAYLTFHEIPRLEGVNLSGDLPNIVQELVRRQLSAAAVMKIASILEKSNSRYVLQKAQWFTPSSYFFTCLKGNEKNFAIKYPKEDPTKPPLRRNIPSDSPADYHSNIIPETRGRELSEQRSKSLVSKNPNSPPPVFNDGLLPRSESEIQLPKFTPEQYFMNENQKTETDVNTIEPSQEQSTLPADEIVGDILISVKTENNDGPEKTNYINEKGKTQTGNIADGPKMQVNKMEAFGNEKNPDSGILNNKTVHIIIDFPQKLDENLSLELKKPKENVASTSPNNLVRQVFTVENKERGMQKFKLKLPKKWRSKSLANINKSNKKRFEVQEIEDSGTYILHLKFKGTSEVGVVPEKEMRTRKTIQDFSMGMPISDSEKKGVIAGEDISEGIKYREKKIKLKREIKSKSISPAQIDSETSESVPASELPNWQQPQYYELLESDSLDLKKTLTPLKKNEYKKFKSDNTTPVLKLSKAKEAEIGGMPPTENMPVGDEARTEVGEPVIKLSKPAEKVKLLAAPVIEEYAEKKETIVLKSSSQINNDEFVTTNYQDPHENTPKAKSALDDRPPPTDWMVPSFMGSTVGRSNEIGTSVEKKSRPNKKLKTSISDSKKGKGKSNKSTYNPKSKIAKSEKCDFDISDFKSRPSSVPIKCDKPTYAMKLSAAYPPLLNEAMKRRYYRYRSTSVFNDKAGTGLQSEEFEMSKKIIEVTPVQVSEKNERSDIVGCQGDGGLRTTKTTSAPKMSDNVSNMANENVMNNKGTASVDSLAMMKKVKEIVDLDLNNAIKIFKPDSASEVSSVVISKGVGEWILDEKELRKCLIIRKSEFLNDMKKAESAVDFFNDVGVNLPKYLPPTKEGQTEMKLNHSVVILNPDTNKFTIDLEELQEAIKRRTEESFDDVVVEKLRGLLTGSKTEPILVFSAADNERMILKSGDSILVFDEETQKWKVDYSILDKRQEQMKIEEELTKRSELILETIEKLEKNNLPSISRPETRDRKTFDYKKEQWKDYESEKKSRSVKSPFKESDAKEIRKKNSDLYENLFVKKDKIKKCDGVKSIEIKLTKQASTTESGTTKETPVTPQKSETVPKEPESSSQKKEFPVELDKKTEDDNYWETFLNMTIPAKSEKEIIDVTESKKSKIRAPGPPPPPPAPPTPPTPPVSPPPGPKIEEPKFKIKLPFTEGEKKKNVKDIPPAQPQPKEKIPKVPISPPVKEKPKLKLPVPPSKTEKQQESKVTVPPSVQPPASKKKDPTVKPVSPPTPAKKEDPKPLTTVKKEGPKEKVIPIKKKEKDVTSSISSTKKAPKADIKKEPKVQAPPPSSIKPKDDPKTGGKKDKAAADHYISENIVELSRNLKDKNSKIKSNKIETVKLNITADRRLPSKVMEINLNKKLDKTKESTEASKKKKKSEKGVDNRIFYKKFEKYKSPFSDLEYEEKSMKIKSDIASNPNLKKLGNWNKTLVLHDIAKPPENIESWLKDETDKMATLLLKVLQEATDGKPRRKSPRAKITDKVHPKPNPYDNIRKKQETTTPGNLFFKPTAPEKMLEVKAAAEKKKDLMKTSSQFISIVPEVKAIPKSLETINPLISEDFLHHYRLASEITEDIPGPEVLKKIANTWKIFPIFSTQMTIFTLLRLFQLVNTGKWFLDIGNLDKSKDHAFGKLFAKYGPIVNVQGLLSGSVILIHKPEHLSAVFEQDASIPVRSVFDSLEKSRRESEDKHLPVGIYTEWNTSKWAELKKNTNDPLLKGRDKFFTVVEAAGDSLLSNILKNKNQQNYASENFLNEIKRWSLEGLCNVLFEKSFGFLEGKSRNKSWMLEPDKLYMAIEEATSYLSKCERGFQMWRLMTTPSAAGLKQSYRTLSGIVGKQIYQAEANLKNKNEMLKNKMQPTKDLTFLESMLLNDGMTPEEITCNLIDIMIVGTNAMTSVLGFLLYDLAQNTKAQNKLLNEIRDILPNKSSRMDIHKFSSLKYLQACLKESLRLHMPVPIFFRMLQSDILLANYIVPKGTYVVMDYRVSCMREQVFEEPEKFNPERWLEDEKWIHSFHPFTTLPLCHGPRAELAKRVVEMQILACVAKVVRNFQVDYQFGEIQETESIFAFPDKPLKFNFVERDF